MSRDLQPGRWTRAILFGLCCGLLPASAQLATPSPRVITTVAGTDITPITSGTAATQAPITVTSVAADDAGNVYIVDEFRSVALKVDTTGKIAPLAGNGFPGYSGDNGPATLASLNNPNGIAVDGAGNVYIGDTYNDRIRMINPQGIITTIAGNGTAAFSGDGGPASAAELNQPSQMLIDGKGNLYFSDFGNERIRMINTSGIINTVAGNGQTAFSGDGGLATAASLYFPEDAVLDSQGRLVIADFYNYRVRRVALNGTISTIAGDGNPSVLKPYSLAADSAGNVYVSDVANNVIDRIDASGNLTVFAGTGEPGYNGENVPALQAYLNYPSSLFFTANGALLLADEFGNRIREISGGLISTVAGDGLQVMTQNGTAAVATVLNRPYGLSFDNAGNMYIADTFNGMVRQVNSQGVMNTIAGTGNLGFSGDGGPAIQAQMNQPMMTAEDAAGNIYVADNQSDRIRRIATDGTISTYVNAIGQVGYNGDNIQASQAALNTPSGIAFDKSGNLLIADTNNNRIRSVSPAGIITTVAGKGTMGYGGDNGLATDATLSAPLDVSVDPSGNILIADTGNQRIRRVSSGVIQTIAGNGQANFTGDGGPATAASLNAPESAASDSAGNIFIADRANYRIREVSGGSISTFAGNGVPQYQGDGGLATAASLVQPDRVVVDAMNNVYIADSKSNRIRVVLVTAPTFQVSTTSITLSAKSNGALTSPQRVPLTSTVVGLQYSYTVSTTDGASWLDVSADAASMPTNLVIQGDPTGLTANTYQGTIQVQSAGGAIQVVQVTFQVAPPDAPAISVSTNTVTFGLVQGAAPASSQVGVTNSGSGSAEFSLNFSTSQGTWLNATASASVVTPTTLASINITADPTGLQPGTYLGSVVVTGAAQNQTVSVVLTVSPSATQLLLSTAALSFRAVEGGGAPMPESFGILNTGQGEMNWTATAGVLGSVPNWLSIDSTSGSVSTPLTGVSTVNVSVNPAGLVPNVYYGRVQVQTPGNPQQTMQTITIVLSVLPSGSALSPGASPSGLVFTGAAGSSPGAQSISIWNPGSANVTYVSSGNSFVSSGNSSATPWFQEAPSSGVAGTSQPAEITVQPDFSSLSQGTYEGSVAIAFSDGSVQSVEVLAVVGASSSTGVPSAAGISRLDVSGGCTPSKLNIVLTGTQSSFTAVVGQPVQIGVTITDNCSNLISNSPSVSVNFYNGATSTNMSPGQAGNWGTNWVPQTAGADTLTVTAFDVLAGGHTLDNQIYLTAQVSAAPSAAVMAPVPGTVQNGASFALDTLVAPGALVSIFGSNFTNGSSQTAQGTPVGTMLDSVQVQMGDSLLPVFYAGPTQLNLQVPFDLPVNTQHQLVIQAGYALSIPVTITAAPGQPGIFTQNQQGFGQGAITNGITYVLAGSSNPVTTGDVVSIYCTGLGTVSPAVPPGTEAPLSPLSWTTAMVSVTIGGVPSDVAFSGLAPTLTGTYQINAIVPAGVMPGPAVPVVIQIGDLTSNAATIAVN